MIVDLPPGLQRVEFSILRFELEFQQGFDLEPSFLLRLRRDLRRGAQLALGRERERFDALFDPDLSSDPVSRKRYQRPGPPFALSADEVSPGSCEAGDRIELQVTFFGHGRQIAPDFAAALRQWGRLGLYRGEGPFDLVGVTAEDGAGGRQRLWREGEPEGLWAPPVLDATWWVDRLAASGQSFRLRFLTPARLLSQGRPLFRPCFANLFPFMLRRVTSMAHAHCGVELIEDPDRLIAAACCASVQGSTLAWQDWRHLQGAEVEQALGGVTGSVDIPARSGEEVFWVLALCSLINLGKAAAYGAGRFRLEATA